MSRTTDMLLSRRAEVEKAIRDATAAWQSELNEIDRALAAIAAAKGNGPLPTLATKPAKSVASQTLAVLGDSPNGLRLREIAEQIQLRFNRNLDRRNVSWHLAMLRRKEKIKRDGEIWKLAPIAQEGKKNQAAV